MPCPVYDKLGDEARNWIMLRVSEKGGDACKKYAGCIGLGVASQEDTRVEAAMLALLKQIMDLDDLTTEGMTRDWRAQALHSCPILVDETPTGPTGADSAKKIVRTSIWSEMSRAG